MYKLKLEIKSPTTRQKNTSTEVLLENILENDTNVDPSNPLVPNTYISTKVGKISTLAGKDHNRECTSGGKNPSSNLGTVVSNVNKTHSLAILTARVLIPLHDLAASQVDFTTSDVGFEPTYANTAIPVSIWENRVYCIIINV